MFTKITSILILSVCAVVFADLPLRADTNVIPKLTVHTNMVRIQWAADPSNAFVLKSTADIAAPMQVTQSNIVAISNAAGMALPMTGGSRFFSVMKLDREGPDVYDISPPDTGIAVASNASVTARLRDATGIDTNAIRLSIGTNAPVTLNDPHLSYTAGLLTYTPASGEVLGPSGSNVTVSLSVADTLGNVTTNVTWSFKTALMTIINSNIVFIGRTTTLRTMAMGQTKAATADGLTLVSTKGDTFTYTYTTATCGLAVGMFLINPDPATGYARAVVSFTDYPASKTVDVVTRVATLAELLQEGSLDSGTFAEVTPAGTKKALNSDATMGLSLNYKYPLDQTLYSDGIITIETLPGSQFELNATLDLKANFSGFKLTDFDVRVNDAADFTLKARAIASGARDYSRETGLITPVHKPFFGMIGPVPVWVDVVFEINAGFAAQWDASAEMQAGIAANKTLTIGRHWNQSQGWTPVYSNPDAACDLIGPEWQVQGDGDLRVYLQPKISVMVYSVAGVDGTLEPYLDLCGHFQANPLQWDAGLSYGLDSSLGLNLSVWDKSWGDVPSKTFNLIPQTLLWQTNYPDKAPEITSQPRDQTATNGATVSFSVQASGNTPMEYRWMRNGLALSDGARISGAATGAMTIQNVKSSDAGIYTVTIANQWGNTNSHDAVLTVQSPFTPTQMVWISPGTFVMGSPVTEALSYSDESQHTVTISKGFYMGKYPVTQLEYQTVVGSNPSYFPGNPDNPVEMVSWNNATNYCTLKTDQDIESGRIPAGWAYRLPTESEWEYACRAQTSTAFYFGDTIHWINATGVSY